MLSGCYATRRSFLLGSALSIAVASGMHASAEPSAKVWKTSGCACCMAWIKHLQQAGFVVEARNVDQATLMKIKLDAGLRAELASCHTANIGDYLVEGHVPAADIQKLINERPVAIGLAVPGMPIGSPGMESGARREAFDVLLVRKDGTNTIYSRYAAKQ